MPVSGDGFTPPRPSLPPLLVAGASLWATTAVAYAAMREVPMAPIGAAAALGVAGLAVCLVCAVRKPALPLALAVVLGFTGGLFVSAASAWEMRSARDALIGEESAWTCILSDDAKPSAFGCRAVARATNEDGQTVLVQLWLPAEGEGLLCGDSVSVKGVLKAPSVAQTERFWASGLTGTLSVADSEVRSARLAEGVASLRRKALEMLQRQGGSSCELVQALVCGYRPPIQATGEYEQFKTVGLAHVVAVSGAHLSMVSALVAFALRAFRLPLRINGALTSAFLVGYVIFAGVPVSALRAACMAAAGLGAAATGRRGSALAALGLCMMVFVGASPACALSVSFALSAASTLGIVLFGPLLTSWMRGLSQKVKEGVAQPLALTMASSMATMPAGAALFSQVPLLGPLSNVMAGPLFALGCPLAFACVAGALLVPSAAPLLCTLANGAVLPLSAVVSLLARLPGTCLPVDASLTPMVLLSVGLCAALWAWWPSLTAARALRMAGLTLALGLVVAIVPNMGNDDEIIMLNVGQGDAFLIRSQGCSVLVDTGNQDGLLKEALARNRVRQLDAVAISHGDDDHCGSLGALRTVALVQQGLVAADALTCRCSSCGAMVQSLGECASASVQGLQVGDKVNCGRFVLTVVWPRTFQQEGGNADSLCLLCQWDGNEDGQPEWSALFCGDAEANELLALSAVLPSEGVDVLKVGHHGSKASVNAQVVERLKPSVALIGVGEANRYGHPAPEVCALLDEAGCAVLRSDEEGDVAVALSEQKLTIRTQAGAGEL